MGVESIIQLLAYLIAGVALLAGQSAVAAGARRAEAFHGPERRSHPRPTAYQTRRRLWLTLIWLMAGVVIVFGNRWHVDAVDVLRRAANEGGWIDHRRTIQTATMMIMLAGASIAGRRIVGRLWRPCRRERLVAVGMTLLTLMAFARLCSHHHVDDILMQQTALGISWRAVIELTGSGIVALATWRVTAWRLRNDQHAQRHQRDQRDQHGRCRSVRTRSPDQFERDVHAERDAQESAVSAVPSVVSSVDESVGASIVFGSTGSASSVAV